MLIAFIKKNIRAFLLCIVFGAIAGGSSSLLLIIVHQSINNYHSVTMVTIYKFLAATASYIIFYVLSDRVLVKLAQESIASLRLQLSQAILNASVSKIESIGLSKVLSIIEHDVNKIGRVIDISPKAIVDLSIFISCMGYLIYLSPPTFLIMILTCTVSILMYVWTNNRVRAKHELNRGVLSTIFQNFQSLVLGVKELQLSSQKRSAFYDTYLANTINTYKHSIIQVHTLIALVKRSVELLLYLCIGVLVFSIPHLFSTIDPSILQGFILVAIFLIKPIESLLGFVAIIPEFSVNMKEVTDLIGTLHQPHNPLPISAPLTHVSELTVTDLTYTYYSSEIDDSFTLGPISTTIYSGQITYIIGGNGSGKTTFAKLLSGLYLPDQGNVSLNGTVITHDNLSWFREHFSAIYSDYYLFEHFLDLGDVNPNKVQHFLDAFHLSQKVTYGNRQFSTTSLSTGQRKRLALIISFLQDRPIYIFDEWASDQDPEFKKVFYTEILLDLKRRNKMVIVITHDDQYFQYADIKKKLSGGKLLQHEAA
jgi:putative ATP-binding cassette transporter